MCRWCWFKFRNWWNGNKIAAAHKATKAGVNMVLANGEEPSIISDILEGQEVGTLFTAKR